MPALAQLPAVSEPALAHQRQFELASKPSRAATHCAHDGNSTHGDPGGGVGSGVGCGVGAGVGCGVGTGVGASVITTSSQYADVSVEFAMTGRLHASTQKPAPMQPASSYELWPSGLQ